MASSSSSHPFSGIETPRVRRKASESSRVFDVFINHRGPDVKETLARQLYNSLKDLEIWAFLDSEEIQHGNSFPSAIANAINSASVHIAIFSKGYAESPWCLEELVLMLQSRAQIIPVFYGVKPSALRYIEKGEYGSAFAKYVEKERYTKKLDKWKEALQTVSSIRGYEINSLNVSDCQKIVSAVQEEVKRRKRLYVAKHPVGLQKLVKDFERRCPDELVQDIQRQCGVDEGGKGKAQIVGIFGMGGVGKTTLAKELFNRKKSQYTRACFLFDVRQAYSNNSFTSLQMQLLKNLFQRDGLNFDSTEEGTSYIGDCIGRSKKKLSFLIVLDDINHVQQLDALLIMDMLKKSKDSLIIVTTRDVGVLINTGIITRYNLKGMNREDARELFCWHAFGQPRPSKYENLVDSFLNVCGGLPLSLQVMGRHVNGRDESYWSSELNKVSKILPRDIHRSLKISFDALDYEEKQIFIDIACFFVDTSKDIAMSVWEASGWSAQSALETLKNKCLVEETKETRKPLINWVLTEGRSAYVDRKMALDKATRSGPRLRMHDHLRDLGREIANELCHPRRLWRPLDLKHLESMGFRNIVAQTKDRCFHSFFDEFRTCRITYFLGESDVSADRSTSLVWLQIEGTSDYSRISSRIPLQNLRCLIIRNLRLKTLWQNQVPTQLQELQIYNTSLKEFSDLSGLSNSLVKIKIDNCNRLKTMSGLSDLKKLIELNISNCFDLQELSVVHLRCLEKMVLHNCYRLKIVSGISHLRKLVELEISKCPLFEQLRLVGLSNLKSITVDYSFKPACFELDGCRNLKTISGILNLEKLVNITIRDCPKLELLPSL